MKHAFKEFRLLSVFYDGDIMFEKQSENSAKPLQGVDRSLVYFHNPDELFDIVSGQSKLKVGPPLYTDKREIIGYVGPDNIMTTLAWDNKLKSYVEAKVVKIYWNKITIRINDRNKDCQPDLDFHPEFREKFSKLMQKAGNDFELNYCPKCNQMTNHLKDQCQKCLNLVKT